MPDFHYLFISYPFTFKSVDIAVHKEIELYIIVTCIMMLVCSHITNVVDQASRCSTVLSSLQFIFFGEFHS